MVVFRGFRDKGDWQHALRGKRKKIRLPRHHGKEKGEMKNFLIACVRRKRNRVHGSLVKKENRSHLKPRNTSQKLILPGTFLVTFGVLTHTRFLHLVVSEYSIYCCLVWTERATNCFVEIGCLFVCLVLVLIPLCVVDVC